MTNLCSFQLALFSYKYSMMNLSLSSITCKKRKKKLILVFDCKKKNLAEMNIKKELFRLRRKPENHFLLNEISNDWKEYFQMVYS